MLLCLRPTHGDWEPAKPFASMDYDTLTSWLDNLDMDGAGEQARFLVREFRRCLSVRAEVPDADQDDLEEKLLAKNAQALSVLKTASSSALRPFRADLLRYPSVFERLGVRTTTRASKGRSAFVVSARERLRTALPLERWRVGGKEASLRFVSLDVAKAIADQHPEGDAAKSALAAQLFLNRPEREYTNLVLEFIGNTDGLDEVANVKLRQGLAASLREAIMAAPPTGTEQATRATVVRIRLDVPGVKTPADDRENKLPASSAALVLAQDFVKGIDQTVTKWATETLPGLLTDL